MASVNPGKSMKGGQGTNETDRLKQNTLDQLNRLVQQVGKYLYFEQNLADKGKYMYVCS